MSSSRTLSLSLALGALSLLGLGCSSPSDAVKANIQQQVGQHVVSGLVGAASGGKVSLTSSGETATITDTKTGSVSAYGANVKLPDSFPKDVPVPSNSTIMDATVDGTGKNAELGFKSTDSASTVASFYETSLTAAGWTKGQVISSPVAQQATYTKANATINVTVISPPDSTDKSTLVTINRTEAAAGTQ